MDKDGTLVRDVPYNVALDRIELMPFAAEAICELSREGYLLIVVSNQSGVARGYFDESALDPVRRFLEFTFLAHGARLHDFLYCPHQPDAAVAQYRMQCSCRKPAPGLLQQAAERWNINLERSWMIGDILNDIEAGNRAGCRTILLDSGGESEWIGGPWRTPDHRVIDWRAAMDIMLARRSLLTA
jgi:histidinol-phosphate phosphatase family protein